MPDPDYLHAGDRLRGTITGQYIGTVIKAWDREVLVCLPDGTEEYFSRLLVEKVPDVEQETGRERIWAV